MQRAKHHSGEHAAVDSRWARTFFTIWIGQAFSLIGSGLVQFALVWWLTARTESGTVLALATLVAVLPRLLMGPVAGALVDRWNRRAVMIAADSLIALATLALAGLFAANRALVWHVYAVLLIRAAGGVFHWPAMAASTSLMVPARHLTRIGGLNQALQGGVDIVAPPLGALLIESVDVQSVLAVDVGTAALAVIPLLFFAIPQPERDPGARDDSLAGTVAAVRCDLIAGLRYVWAWPGLRALLVLAMAINFCLFPATALLPILVKTHFSGGAAEFGWVQSAWGAGVIAGGLILGVWGGFERRIATSMAGLIGMGICFLVVGFTPGSALGVMLGAMVCAGIMLPIHGGPLFAALQATVDPAKQGRVLALVSSVTTLVVPISLGIAGPLSDWLGTQVWYIVGGALCILLGSAAFAIPVLMGFEENAGAAAPVSAAGD